MPLAWLFDIDGTLIRSYGTAREAFSEATRVVLGIEDDLLDYPFSGGLDPLLLAGIEQRHDRVLDPEQKARFWEVVYAYTSTALAAGRSRQPPGVLRVLEEIRREPDWILGVLTGNRAPMARLKLEHFGLKDFFAIAYFGDDAENRDELAKRATAEIRQRWGIGPSRCIVVGDADSDVRCARAAGARSVAVMTGTRKREHLEPLGPDLLLDDLSDWEGLITWARGVEASGLDGSTIHPHQTRPTSTSS